MVTIEIRNAGTAESGRPKLNNMLKAACEAVDDLGLKGESIQIDFRGDLVQRRGPLDIQINLSDEKNKPSSAEARRRLAENICAVVRRYYSEQGHPARQAKVTVGSDVSWEG